MRTRKNLLIFIFWVNFAAMVVILILQILRYKEALEKQERANTYRVELMLKDRGDKIDG